MFGKPTNVTPEDLSKYLVEIEAASRFLPLLAQQFSQRGYCPEKMRIRTTKMENVIAARRLLPNQRADEVRFVIGNYDHICKHFGLEPLSEI